MSSNNFQKKKIESYNPNNTYEWSDSFASNQEFINDYLHRKPTHDRNDYFNAIADSINQDYNLKKSPIITVTPKMVAAAFGGSSAGLPIGAIAKNKKEITMMTHKNGVSTYPDTRMTTDGRLIEVGQRSVQKYGASIKDISKNGAVFGADPFPYLVNRTRDSIPQTPEAMAASVAREATLAAQTKELDAESDIYDDLDKKITQFTGALVIAEVRGLKEINIAKGIRGSDLTYAQNKHFETHPRDVDDYYKNAFAMPKGYNFLNLPDPSLDSEVLKLDGDSHEDMIERARKINELADINLETIAAHLKVVDANTSPDDDEHPLLVAYEEEYGPVRDLTAKELERVNLLEGKVPPIPENKKQFDADNREIAPPFFGGDIFVGSLKISDFGNRDAPLSSGQVFYANKNYKEKYNIQNNSLMDTVNVVGGDPHADKIDEVFVLEGAATAASLKEIMDDSDRLGLTDYASKNVLILSAYNAANFISVAKTLHHKYPDTPVNAVSDQDIKVKLEAGSGRPELDEKGGYLFLTRSDSPPLSEAQLPKTQKEQKDILVVNQGADAAQTINEYVVENPNIDSDGKFILPQTAAFVINKGNNGLGSQIIPQLSPDTGDKSVTERRLSPKVDVNDLVERGKKVVEQALLNMNKKFKSEDKPLLNVTDRTHKLKESLAQILTATITSPSDNMRQALQRKVASNIDTNYYAERDEKKAALAQQEISDREAAKQVRYSNNRNDYSNTKSDVGSNRPDEPADSKPSLDRVEAGKRDPELSSLANKYGSSFMSASNTSSDTKTQDYQQTQKQEPVANAPANDEPVPTTPTPTPNYANSMRP